MIVNRIHPTGARTLAERYEQVRSATERLCEPLEIEDYIIQADSDCSPIKWHLAHTTWFFETFVLTPHLTNYQPFHAQFNFLFNSYYQAVGDRWPRPQRGLLSRPTVAEVYRYRTHVDEQMAELLHASLDDDVKDVAGTILLGLHHEQQHQELMIADLKQAWSVNPLHPVYREGIRESGQAPPLHWQSFPEGLAWIGHEGTDFAFDNERPRHRVFQQGFQLASRLVTNAEFLAFIDDAGYQRHELWLSDGWDALKANGWNAPLYWKKQEGEWFVVTLGGRRRVLATEPVCHISYYEADAFARWAGARLPTEIEWEIASAKVEMGGHFLEGGRFHPAAVCAKDDLGPIFQMFGDVWQWTASPYNGYPGYQPLVGALGEYNGKFMCNQIVLRGASCVTPRSHARRTYRNFFPPDARWQFSGIRLAKEPK